MDPFTLGAGKTALSAAAKPTLAYLRELVARRGAGLFDAAALGSADPELDEAIAVLRGTSQTLPGTIAAKFKGWVSQRPSSFADEEAQRFIEDARVITLVKSGARKTLNDRDIDEELREGRTIHAELFGGEGFYGETLIEDAVHFAALSLLSRLTAGDRVMLDLRGEQHDEVLQGLQHLHHKLDTHDAAANSPAVDTMVLDQAVAGEVRKLRRQRFIHGKELVSRAEAFGDRLNAGLHLASAEMRASAFREIAIILVRAERGDDAERWIDRAADLGADVTCERARLAMARQRSDYAMLMLRDRRDPISQSLLLDAIQRRDGETETVRYFEANLSPSDLTGHALHAMASRLFLMDRRSDAEALLDKASPEQVDENPLLLYLRARTRIAGTLPPDIADRFLEVDGLIPHPGDVRDDEEGQQRLAQARNDLLRFRDELTDLDAPDWVSLADVNLVSIDLNFGSAEDRARGRRALLDRMTDPYQAIEFAPIAALYRLDFDWEPIRGRLAQAERLGGYDETQLRAAFALVMRDGRPQDISDFIAKYKDRLEQFQSRETVVGIEIEARARLGDTDGARALLDREREKLPLTAVSFLEATVAEAAGEDSVALRLAQFEVSGTTHDLQILVNTLGEKGDPRLGEYLIKLWRQRHQLDDAHRACDALVQAGKEVEAEAFLEELGELARQDHFLRTHLAWARQRQGRLLEAIEELSALAKAGVDTQNTRQLTILLAVESGRWSELEPFVQRELAAKDQRTASQLVSAAHVAQAIDSPTAIPLVRAAIAKNPDEPALNMAGYTIAVNSGYERTAEVSGWFGKALANSTDEGPLHSKDFDEVVEMLKDAREQSERVNELVNTAQVPIFIALGQARGTQSAIVFLNMPNNAAEADSRRRSVLPFFAGNRSPITECNPKSIAFEPLSILVLDYLGLLDCAIGAFDDVVLPSGTLQSFFDDRKNVGHSQPSRIAQAREIKDRVSAGTLMIEDLPAAELSPYANVDDEFARLFGAANARDGYVVDTAPLHPPGKLHETVDPKPFAVRLVSPAGLVQSLLRRGAISQATASAAAATVAGSGAPFDDEIEPLPGKPMFLTNLAIQYLSDAGLLHTLRSYAGTLTILPEVAQLADREITAGEASAKVRQGVERVRETLANAISSGRVRVGPRRYRKGEAGDDNDTGDAGDHRMVGPVVNAMRDAGGVDALVCDDRAMNKYVQFEDRTGRKIPFLTTPDILTLLHRKGVLDSNALAAARERLRIAGAGLMPLEPTELVNATLGSNWQIGPNAELRAIRDSIHLPLARRIIQLPQERTWFRAVCLCIGFAIRRVWQDMDDVALAEKAASFLFDMLPDPGAWGASDASPDRDLWVQDVTRHTLWAIASVFDLPSERVEAFQRWFAVQVCPSAERRDPGAMEAIARTLFTFLSTPMPATEGDHRRIDEAQ